MENNQHAYYRIKAIIEKENILSKEIVEKNILTEQIYYQKLKRYTYIAIIIGIIFSICVGVFFNRVFFSHQVYGANTICYVTNTGQKYHADYCSYLRKSSNKTDVYHAKKRGYTPCSRCNVGKLDISVKEEYLFSIMLVGIIYFLSLFLVRRLYITSSDKKNQKELNSLIDNTRNIINSILQNYTIKEIVGVPTSYDIVNHLPVLIGSKNDYGQWSCFYCATGERIHLKYGCNGATIKTHAFLVVDKEVCHVCGKNISIVIPSWYNKYKELIAICEKYNINY